MEREKIEKQIINLKRNIKYYTKVYGPDLKKVSKMKKKLMEQRRMLGGEK